MPIQAAAAMGRKVLLSRARREGAASAERQKLFKEKAFRIARGEEKVPGRKENIALVEIIFVAAFFALPNDLLDLLELTIIGKIATIIIDLAFGFILFAWFLLRVQEKPERKFVKWLIGALVEFMPLIGMLPVWTLLVLNVRFRLLEKLLKAFVK